MRPDHVSGEKPLSAPTYFVTPLPAPFPLRVSCSALRSAPSFFCNSRLGLRSTPLDFRLATLRVPLRQ